MRLVMIDKKQFLTKLWQRYGRFSSWNEHL